MRFLRLRFQLPLRCAPLLAPPPLLTGRVRWRQQVRNPPPLSPLSFLFPSLIPAPGLPPPSCPPFPLSHDLGYLGTLQPEGVAALRAAAFLEALLSGSTPQLSTANTEAFLRQLLSSGQRGIGEGRMGWEGQGKPSAVPIVWLCSNPGPPSQPPCSLPLPWQCGYPGERSVRTAFHPGIASFRGRRGSHSSAELLTPGLSHYPPPPPSLHALISTSRMHPPSASNQP